jgi:hypothetical protein
MKEIVSGESVGLPAEVDFLNLSQEVIKVEPVMESVPTAEGQEAAAKALDVIRARSFQGRNPDLGKMFKCQICKLRHRGEQCEQKFATGRYDTRDPKPLLIAGETPETEPFPHHTKIKIILGRAAFAKKRHQPHLNYRTLQFVELVRALTPDEYTQEDLTEARRIARRALAKKYGRHGYLPYLGKRQPKPAEAQEAL